MGCNRRCSICGGDVVQKITHISMIKDVRHNLPNEYDVVVCENCGFGYADTTAVMEDYDYYYSLCNDYGTSPKDLEREYFLQMLEDIMPFIKEVKSIADVGAGKGRILQFLSEKQWDVKLYGVDPSQASIECMQKINGVIPIRASIYDKPNFKVDFCVLRMVFEHLLKPDIAVQRLHQMLNEAGYAYVTVPDCGNLYGNSAPLADTMNYEHINYFSEKSLDNIFTRNGFKKVLSKSTKLPYQYGENAEVRVVYQRVESAGDEVVKDEGTIRSIRDYLSRVEKLSKVAEEKIKQLCEAKNTLYVWGTGNYCMQLLENTPLKHCKIRAFVDNNSGKVGKRLISREIISAQTLKEKIDMNDVIVVCSMLHAETIRKQIREMGMCNEVVLL